MNNDRIDIFLQNIRNANAMPPQPSSAMGGAASYPYVRDTVSSLIQVLSLMQSRIEAQDEEIKILKEQISKQNQNYMPPDSSLDSPLCDAYDDRKDDVGFVHPDDFGGSDYYP